VSRAFDQSPAKLVAVKKWRAANPESARESRRRYRITHRVELRAYAKAKWKRIKGSRGTEVLEAAREAQRRYRQSHPDAVKKSQQDYRASHRDAVNAAQRHYRRPGKVSKRSLRAWRAERERIITTNPPAEVRIEAGTELAVLVAAQERDARTFNIKRPALFVSAKEADQLFYGGVYRRYEE
jgi:hypothetical protein